MRVLVVDDEKLLVKGIKFNLENDGYEVLTGSDGQEALDLLACARTGDKKCLELENKKPKTVDGRPVLDFKGRGKLSSRKNFQIAKAKDSEEVCLQFAKLSKEEYVLDFTAPLSPLLAFATALTAFF